MQAGRLRHLIRIERPVQTRSGDRGGYTTTWQTVVDDLPADVIPLSGRELLAAQSTQSEITTRCTIRWRDDLNATMRVVHTCCGGAVHNIRAILPDPTFRRHINLMLTTGTNDGR